MRISIVTGIAFILVFASESKIARGSTDPHAASAHASKGHATDQAKGHEKHWGYEGGEGPLHWGELKSEFKLCGQGKAQSPVDIQSPLLGRPEPIQFMYRPTSGEIVNNGHTIQVNLGKGSAIRVGGVRYELLQFHFHTPSEHSMHGRLADLELHFVHKSAKGKLAVVGVMIEKGSASEWLGQLWRNIPREIATPISLTEHLVNPFVFLPEDKEYFSYSGSLTTPPCSEGVSWNVMKNPITLSLDQIKLFQAFYSHNARPVQPLLGRKVTAH